MLENSCDILNHIKWFDDVFKNVEKSEKLNKIFFKKKLL